LFVTNYRNISLIGDPRYPIRTGVSVEFESPTSPDSASVKKLPATTQFGSAQSLASKAALTATPKLRGLIHDNWDEWTGKQPTETPPDDPQEIEDLIAAAVDEAAANAANMDRVDTIVDSSVDKAQTGGGGPSKDPAPPVQYVYQDCVALEGEGENRICVKADGSRVPIQYQESPYVAQGPVVDPGGGLNDSYWQQRENEQSQKWEAEEESRNPSTAANSQSAIPGSSEGEHRAR